jgi:hypothetical protein
MKRELVKLKKEKITMKEAEGIGRWEKKKERSWTAVW